MTNPIESSDELNNNGSSTDQLPPIESSLEIAEVASSEMIDETSSAPVIDEAIAIVETVEEKTVSEVSVSKDSEGVVITEKEVAVENTTTTVNIQHSPTESVEANSEFISTESEFVPEQTIPSEVMTLMSENVTSSYGDTTYDSEGNNTTSTTASGSKTVSSVYGNYEDYQLLPDAPWPPPVFIRKNVSPQERYYIEHRWYSQWSFFDKKATENKNKYFRTQIIVGVGSVTVPVLVGIRLNEPTIDTILYVLTIIISLSVAISTAVESLYTFGDNWRSYRKATEDLNQEKSLYDVKAGRYENNPQPFIRFVERCEEIVAQQNGQWVQSQEKQAQRASEQAEEFLDKYIDDDDDDVEINQTKSTTSYSVTETTVAKSDPNAISDSTIITPADESAYSAG